MGQPLKKLTHRQRQLLDAKKDPKFKSTAQAAKSIGMHRGDASVMLSKPTVAKTLLYEEKQKLDKAQVQVRASERMRRKVSRALDKLELDGLDPIEVVAVARQSLEMERIEHEIKARYPDLEDPEKGLSAVDVFKRRILAIGRYLQRRADRIPPVEVL